MFESWQGNFQGIDSLLMDPMNHCVLWHLFIDIVFIDIVFFDIMFIDIVFIDIVFIDIVFIVWFTAVVLKYRCWVI